MCFLDTSQTAALVEKAKPQQQVCVSDLYCSI